MKKLAQYFSLQFFICLSLFSQDFNRDELESKIDALIPEQVSDTTPGGVIGIVRDGELIYSRGYGMANLSYSIPNDSKMVYNIGSVSKQFLGYAFAMLHAEGKIDINDPVNNYLEDWPVFEHEVKLIHLLTHSSGYREAYTMSNLAGREVGVDRLSREECLNVVRKQPALEFVPGSRYTYNSTAWVILAEVFEEVTGKSAEDWVQSNILDPLGMESTQIETYVGEVIKNSAESYSLLGQGLMNQKSNRAIFGAAEVYTSLEDMAKWINNYKTAKVGGEKVKELFLTPFMLNDGINSEYALGIFNNKHNGLKMYSHTGGHEAFVTQVRYYPEADLGIIVISNYGWRGNISANEVAEELLGDSMVYPEELKSTKVNRKKLETFAGLYVQSTLNSTMNISVADNKLTLDGETILIPTDKTSFGIEGWDGTMQFEEAEDGIKKLIVSEPHYKNTYYEIDPWDAKSNELSAFEGEYWSEELEAIYQLKVNDGELFMHHRWLAPIKLTSVSKDFFRTGYGFYVKFNRDSGGAITNLTINSRRTINVIFVKMNSR